MIVDIKKIEELWYLNLKQDEKWHLYLHIPFCYTKCKYCMYTGNMVNSSSYKQNYHSYFYEYLPKVITGYKNIMETKPFESVYIGGGTPNVMKPDTMKHLFEMIPNFKYIPIKAIDMHPAFTTKEQIDILKEFGFTLICFGIQTFDNDTLKKNDRAPVKLEQLKELIDYCSSKNIYTSIDLMCYLNTYTEKDIETLIIDLDISTKLDLTFIAINPNLHFVLHNNKYAQLFINETAKYFENHSKYTPEYKISKSHQLNDRFIFRVIKHECCQIFYSDILTYFADDFPEACMNILGIGDLNNPHSTMSYVKDKFYYVEKNINGKPMFDIRYMKNNNKESIQILKEKLSKCKAYS